jgi:hypothetical protein
MAAAAAERDRIAQRLQSELDPALARMRPVGGGKSAAYVPSEMLIEQAKCVRRFRPSPCVALAARARATRTRARTTDSPHAQPRAPRTAAAAPPRPQPVLRF